MDFNRLTQKSQEALADAQTRAAALGHIEIDGEHLLLSLLDQPEGLLPRLMERMQVSADALRRRLTDDLDHRPKVSNVSTQPNISRRLGALLNQAEEEAKRLKDEYVSIEHLVLAFIEEGTNTPAGKMLRDLGVSRDSFLKALTEVRGNQRVTSQNPEGTYEALEKFGRDLVSEARANKLDPVIGRDAEIRRTIRI